MCDPWYFLDIEHNLKDENDNPVELNEAATCYPDGSWHIDLTEYSNQYITFKNNEYNKIIYDNTSKYIDCFKDDVRHDTFTITVT